MSQEKERVDAYVGTVGRFEPNIAMVDRDAALASIAISLKRIADGLDSIGISFNNITYLMMQQRNANR